MPISVTRNLTPGGLLYGGLPNSCTQKQFHFCAKTNDHFSLRHRLLLHPSTSSSLSFQPSSNFLTRMFFIVSIRSTLNLAAWTRTSQPLSSAREFDTNLQRSFPTTREGPTLQSKLTGAAHHSSSVLESRISELASRMPLH